MKRYLYHILYKPSAKCVNWRRGPSMLDQSAAYLHAELLKKQEGWFETKIEIEQIGCES